MPAKRDPRTGRMVSTHGYFGTRVYRIWQGVKNRATNNNDKDASRYIDRGINIDPRWMDFRNFLADMGEPPSDAHSVERKDNSRGYWPDNCVWALPKEQARNRSSNVLIEFNGETKCLLDWAKTIGVSHSCLAQRLKKWPKEKALTKPSIRPSKNYART